MDSPPVKAGLGKRIEAFLMAHLAKGYEKKVGQRKRALLGDLTGTILELGPGTGPNLKFYKPGIRWIGFDPNPYMHPYLRREAERLGLEVELRSGLGESIGLPDASVDAVVSTLVMCSVADPAMVMREVLRVLKPDGRFIFIEHVAAQRGTWLRRVQRFLRPLWRAIGDGCTPDRETWVTIEEAGFERMEIEHFRIPTPVVGPHIAGLAIKRPTESSTSTRAA